MRTNRKDLTLIQAIADRAVSLAFANGQTWKYQDALMDLLAAHCDCPLRLEDLLNADDVNFAHDVFGINRHLDRNTLILTDCFLPRCAK